MMSALEQEIMDKFRLLDKEARQRIRLQIDHETDDVSSLNTIESMSADEWLKWAVNFGDYIHNKYGTLRPSSVDLLEGANPGEG